MPRVPRTRHNMGPPADVPDMWPYWLLRLIADATRQPSCPIVWTRHCAIGGARRNLALVRHAVSYCWTRERPATGRPASVTQSCQDGKHRFDINWLR